MSGISVVFTKNQKKASVKMATTNREVAFTSKDAEAEEEQGNGLDYENTIDIGEYFAGVVDLYHLHSDNLFFS